MICKVSRIFPASFYLPSASCTTEHALREPSWPMPVFSRHTALLLLLAFSLKCPAAPAKLEDLPQGHIHSLFLGSLLQAPGQPFVLGNTSQTVTAHWVSAIGKWVVDRGRLGHMGYSSPEKWRSMIGAGALRLTNMWLPYLVLTHDRDLILSAATFWGPVLEINCWLEHSFEKAAWCHSQPKTI